MTWRNAVKVTQTVSETGVTRLSNGELCSELSQAASQRKNVLHTQQKWQISG